MLPAVRLSEMLGEGQVLRLAGSGRDEVLLELAELAQKLHWVVDAGALQVQLLEREALGTTAVGAEVAIPHAKVEEVPGVRLAVGLSAQGVAFGASDGRLSRLFFLVLTSPRAPSLHIRVLAQVSRLAKAPGLVARLLAAESPREVLAELHRLELGAA